MNILHIQTVRNAANGRVATVSYSRDDGIFHVTYTDGIGRVLSGVEDFDPREYDGNAKECDAAARLDAEEAAKLYVNGHLTNQEMLYRLMDRDALVQAFVVEAVRKYAEQIDATPLEQFPRDQWISPEAWKAASAEVTRTIAAHLAR